MNKYYYIYKIIIINNNNKKKGRRRFNPKREVAIAQRIIRKDKQEKFLKSMLILHSKIHFPTQNLTNTE